MYAVASEAGRAHSAGNPWTPEDFYAQGEAEWPPIEHHWKDYAGTLPASVIEVGCGAGRMTRVLAGHCERVVGVDVSPAQIELAKRAVEDRPAETELVVGEGAALPAPSGSVEGAFSTHVFQHLSAATCAALLAECGRVVAPGGTVMLHLPVPGANETGTMLAHRARKVAKLEPLRKAALRIGHRLGRTVPPMSFRVVDPAWVFERLERAGFEDVELRVFDVGGMRHSFFLGRRASR
jgi:ubiquinone/menaquinone biosynthesis C-methylase UbiE